MKEYIGFNAIGEQVSGEEALALVRSLGKTAVLFINNPGAANYVKEHEPSVEVFFRWTGFPGAPRGDDDLHVFVSAENTWKVFMGLGLRKDIVLVLGNEPTQEYALLAHWTIALMEHAHDAGWKVCVLNFSVANPDDAGDWERYFLSVLQLAAEYNFYVGVHEYINGTLEASVGWTVGYVKEAIDLCHRKGFMPPMFVVNEYGYDLSGSWDSLGIGAENAALELMAGVVGIYVPLDVIRYVLIFCLGNWSNGKWQYNAKPVLEEIAKFGENMPELKTVYIKRKANTEGYTFANVRKGPASRYEDVGDVGLTEIPAIERPDWASNDGRYLWRYFSFEEARAKGLYTGEDGFIASELIDINTVPTQDNSEEVIKLRQQVVDLQKKVDEIERELSTTLSDFNYFIDLVDRKTEELAFLVAAEKEETR